MALNSRSREGQTELAESVEMTEEIAEPVFLLPETAEDWRDSKSGILENLKEEQIERGVKLLRLDIEVAEAKKIPGANGELTLRSLKEKIQDINASIASAPRQQDLLLGLECRIRTREQKKIAKEGRVVLDGKAGAESRRDRLSSEIRRLVIFQNRPFVCSICMQGDGSESVAWVTDSLAQMNEVELRALLKEGF